MLSAHTHRESFVNITTDVDASLIIVVSFTKPLPLARPTPNAKENQQGHPV
jgi:hypothetical protein